MATSSDSQVNKAGGTTQPENIVALKGDVAPEEKREEEEEEEEENPINEVEYWRYLPLYKAALRGDWETAKRFFDRDEAAALTASITELGETALHIAVGVGEKSLQFVENLVELMPVEALELRQAFGDTALNVAATVGNTKAAVILVKKNPRLLYIRGYQNYLPVHNAARTAQKETLSYLLTVTKDDDDPVLSNRPFASDSGVLLLLHVICAGFYDVALNLVRRYPQLAKQKAERGSSALEEIAKVVSAIPSGSRLSSWQRLIYSHVPVKLENYVKDNRGDIENPINSSQVIAQKYDWAQTFGENFSISGLS